MVAQNLNIGDKELAKFMIGRAMHYGKGFSVIEGKVISLSGNNLEISVTIGDRNKTQRLTITISPKTKITYLDFNRLCSTFNVYSQENRDGIFDFFELGRKIKIEDYPQLFKSPSQITPGLAVFMIAKKKISPSRGMEIKEIKEIYFTNLNKEQQ